MEQTRRKTDTKKTSINRRALLGIAHIAAKQFGWDDDHRHCVQEDKTGKRSLSDLSDTELLDWCWYLKQRLGAEIGIPHPPRRGGKNWDRPTLSQLGEIEKLALEFGWADGLDDERLTTFIQHTAKVDNVRFLMSWQATHVISGLRRWQKQIQAKQQKATA